MDRERVFANRSAARVDLRFLLCVYEYIIIMIFMTRTEDGKQSL